MKSAQKPRFFSLFSNTPFPYIVTDFIPGGEYFASLSYTMYVLSALDFYDLYSFVVFFIVLIINALKKGSEYL